jgi:C4-dicarboxylate-specific signal transduction histidine kinase
VEVKSRKVLIVDDNEAIHDDFRKILKSNGNKDVSLQNLESQLFGEPVEAKYKIEFEYELSFCTQGADAISAVDKAKQEGKPFSLIFMDVRMPPGIDGIETAARIRRHHQDIQIVICSAYTDYSWHEILEKLGTNDNFIFLKKPFDRMEVQQIALAFTTKWSLSQELNRHLSQLEEIIIERTKELEASRAQSIESAKFAALGVMSGGLAHELNTPLGTLTLMSSYMLKLLESSNPDLNEIKNQLLIIQATASRVASIVKGLREFSGGGANSPMEVASVEQIIQDTLVFCQSRFTEHKVQLKVMPIAPDVICECKPVQISQVLLNLLNNAFDAVMEIDDKEEKWIRVDSKNTDFGVEISVTDSGKGIPKEIINKIMEPFFTTKMVGKGTGLGLSISKGLAESSGGQLFVDQACPNTKFIIRLPHLQRKVDAA